MRRPNPILYFDKELSNTSKKSFWILPDFDDFRGLNHIISYCFSANNSCWRRLRKDVLPVPQPPVMAMLWVPVLGISSIRSFNASIWLRKCSLSSFLSVIGASLKKLSFCLDFERRLYNSVSCLTLEYKKKGRTIKHKAKTENNTTKAHP